MMNSYYICIRYIVIIMMVVTTVFCTPLYAQQSNNNVDTLVPPPKKNRVANPEDYYQEDFADWLYYTYRFTAIAVGSIPFSLLFASMIYDTYKTIDTSIATSTFESTYLPLFFSGPNKPPYSDEEVQTLLWSTLAISLTISLVDLIVLLIKQRRVKNINLLFD